GQKLQSGLSGYWHFAQNTVERSAPQYGQPALPPLSFLPQRAQRSSAASSGREIRYTRRPTRLPTRTRRAQSSGRGIRRSWASMYTQLGTRNHSQRSEMTATALENP